MWGQNCLRSFSHSVMETQEYHILPNVQADIGDCSGILQCQGILELWSCHSSSEKLCLFPSPHQVPAQSPACPPKALMVINHSPGPHALPQTVTHASALWNTLSLTWAPSGERLRSSEWPLEHSFTQASALWNTPSLTRVPCGTLLRSRECPVEHSFALASAL